MRFLSALGFMVLCAFSSSLCSAGGVRELVESNETPRPPVKQGALRAQDIECIWEQIQKKADNPKKSKLLTSVAARLAPELSAAMNKYRIHSVEDQALFLSQILYESYGFQLFSEMKNGSIMNADWQKMFYQETAPAHSPTICAQYKDLISKDNTFFDSPYERVTPACTDDNQYEEKKRTIVSSYKARWRGRGIIHLTHCYNYVTYAFHRAKPGGNTEGVNTFSYRDRSGKMKSITSSNSYCSPDEIKDLISHYKSKGIDLDKDKLLTDPDRMSDFCQPEMMADAAAWFWTRGGNSCQKRATQPLPEGSGLFCQCSKGDATKASTCKPIRSSKTCDCTAGKVARPCFETPGNREAGVAQADVSRVARVTACVNGRGCYGLKPRHMYFTVVRDFLKSDRKGCLPSNSNASGKPR